jgi:hypothetical protein
MGEREAGEKGDGEGGEFGFHGWIGLGWVWSSTDWLGRDAAERFPQLVCRRAKRLRA